MVLRHVAAQKFLPCRSTTVRPLALASARHPCRPCARLDVATGSGIHHRVGVIEALQFRPICPAMSAPRAAVSASLRPRTSMSRQGYAAFGNHESLDWRAGEAWLSTAHGLLHENSLLSLLLPHLALPLRRKPPPNAWGAFLHGLLRTGGAGRLRSWRRAAARLLVPGGAPPIRRRSPRLTRNARWRIGVRR